MCDESIWNLIGPRKKFCSFKLNTETISLCKNENNNSGICEFSNCPLANSKYATIREIKGRLYLFKKEPERVNMPSRVYEKILLNKEYDKALLEIEECLKFYDPVLIHKCKQKLGKLTQYLIRKYELDKNDKIKLVARRKKAQKIERNRSIKILERMDIEKEIKEELQLRLEENLFGEEIKEKMKENIENEKIKRRKRIFIAEFDESDEFYKESDLKGKEKTEKKEKAKLKW